MTAAADPFSRLYWRLIDDAKFVDVYPDDHHFALWARLLMAADMAWPASASLPFGARKVSLRRLVDAGIVDVLPSGRFRIRGLDAERAKRQKKASNAAGSRWDGYEQPLSNATGSGEHPPSSANGMPREEKRSQEEIQPEQSQEKRSQGIYPAKALVTRATLGAIGAPDDD